MPEHLSQKKRIMVVDNEDGVCEIYKRILVVGGFEVEAFMGGENAIDRAARKKI